MNNQRGGIISKLFLIPAGICLMLGFFFLGYYVGKYQTKNGPQSGLILPLPDVVAKNLPKQDEFTFYKTLTDKDGRTVSIDLKSGPKNSGAMSENKQDAVEVPKTAVVQPVSDKKEGKPEQAAASSQAKETPAKTQKAALKQQPSKITLRYTVQVASYPDKGLAEDKVREIKKHGYAAFIASSELPGKGLWHRVRLGSFQNRAAAEKLQKDIRVKEGISTIVVTE